MLVASSGEATAISDKNTTLTTLCPLTSSVPVWYCHVEDNKYKYNCKICYSHSISCFLARFIY